jgi:filamentous hemagglutinin
VDGLAQGFLNAIPGAYYAGQSQLAWQQDQYAISVVLYAGALADAAIGVLTLGQGSLAIGAVRSTTIAARGVAGSIRGVNPLRSATNCVNCAIATDATLAGRAASALPSGPTSISVLERMFGGRFVSVSGPGAIESQLLNAGSGTRGIVFGSRGAGEVGHVFNAVNQNGVVRFLDGQIGGAASLEGYTSFYFLRTF